MIKKKLFLKVFIGKMTYIFFYAIEWNSILQSTEPKNISTRDLMSWNQRESLDFFLLSYKLTLKILKMLKRFKV